MLYTVVMANELDIQQRQSLIIAQYHLTEIFAVLNDGLSKSTMPAMAHDITSTGNLSPYVLDRLFDNFLQRIFVAC